MRCSASQCVAVLYSALQYVAVHVAVHVAVYVAVYVAVVPEPCIHNLASNNCWVPRNYCVRPSLAPHTPCVAACCKMLQCVAVCYSVLHHRLRIHPMLQRVAVCCSVLQSFRGYDCVGSWRFGSSRLRLFAARSPSVA